jgi:acetyl esterase/lipase
VPTPPEVELSPQAQNFARWFDRYQTTPDQLEAMRLFFEANHLMSSEPEAVTYRDVDADGVRAIWVEPAGSNKDFVLLHSHNGGTVLGSAAVERKSAGHFAKAVGIPSLVVDFRLAPENKYPAQIDDVETAYRWLLKQGYAAKNIVAYGHSVGGYLAPALALRLRDAGEPLPAAVVSISPWADLTISNETMETHRQTDNLLSKETLEFFRQSWIGDTDISEDDERINLVSADLSGLPPTLVSWGTYEVLAGEDEVFAERLSAAGVDTEALPVPGLQHSYVHGAGRVPEVDSAIQHIAAWVRLKAGI